MPLPAFCQPLEQQWLLPFAIPAATLVSCHFNAELLSPDDFVQTGIAPVAGRAKRQSEYLAGRLCARSALQQVTGMAWTPEKQADGAPRWPNGVTGSITHSHGWAAAIAAPQSQVASIGIDAESILAPERAERLKSEILTARELLNSDGLDRQALAHLVTLTFSLKESLYKALFPLTHEQFYFSHAELLETHSDGSASLQLLIDLNSRWRKGCIIHGQFVRLDERVLTLVSIPAGQ